MLGKSTKIGGLQRFSGIQEHFENVPENVTQLGNQRHTRERSRAQSDKPGGAELRKELLLDIRVGSDGAEW